jgi:hypothetical protein
LRLVGLERELAGARWSAARVHVGLDRHGLAVDVFDLVRTDVPRTAVAPTPGPSSAAAPARPMRVDLHGLPAHVRVHGRTTLLLPRGLEATVVDPRVAIDAAGVPRASATAIVALPRDHELVLADARLEPAEDGRWRVAATASLDGGPSVAVAGTLAPTRMHLRARADDGAASVAPANGDAATLEVEIDRGAQTRVALRAHGWPLATVGPAVVAELEARGVSIAQATMDGAATVVLGDASGVHAEGLVVDGVRLDDRRLASRAVQLSAVRIDGTLERSAAGSRAELTLDHRGAKVHAELERTGSRVRGTVELGELPCERLLAAFPDGMLDALAGARVTGTIAGTAEFDLDLARLSTVDLDVDAPPGTIALDFPVLSACASTEDPPGIDLAALRGPYRHVFVAGGRRHDRVLASGAPQFVPLARARRIAAAFVALEDMRFRSHDGFDREQIERAFWHNLVAGGVRRGASTISQQTARNLWLGVDRSLARKLQEAWLTARLEATVDKDRILELYMNVIELGPGVFGIADAARHHFGRDADELDVLQAIHLAALAPAPRTLSRRFASGEVDDAWLAELREHARRMHRNGMIDDAELVSALRSDLRLRAHATSADAAP